MGEEPFRRGVHSYLEARRDGSATSADFLDALTHASRLPVAPAFDTFLNQNGVPQVEVRLQCETRGAKLALTQHRLEDARVARPRRRSAGRFPSAPAYGSGASCARSAR